MPPGPRDKRARPGDGGRKGRKTGDEPGDKTSARKVRSAFGTRVARAIVCSNCGAKDSIHFSPRDPKRALCRSCAAKLLGVVDEEARIGLERELKCPECGRTFKTEMPDREDRPLVCSDCHHGIITAQANRSKSGVRLSKGVVRVRRERRESEHEEE